MGTVDERSVDNKLLHNAKYLQQIHASPRSKLVS